MSLTTSLTEAEINQERAWLARFNQALDTLDVHGRLAPFFAENIFVQFANDLRINQKGAVLAQLATLFGYFQLLKHSTIRVSFDPATGLIYHTASVSDMIVKGDPQERVFTVPALTVIHKQPGEDQTTGMEVYIDIGAAKEVLQELFTIRGTE
ncbi:hypothetical protein FRC07_011823 [Ceratobasidium sp. 392]|nr:hypothetical protein FRC07_011823 [Ceratobasidium sp. 392]